MPGTARATRGRASDGSPGTARATWGRVFAVTAVVPPAVIDDAIIAVLALMDDDVSVKSVDDADI